MGKGKVDLEELFLNVVRVSLRFNRVCVWEKYCMYFLGVFLILLKKECIYI